MQSWELVQQKRNSVLIGIIIAPPVMVSLDWAFAFAALEKPPQWIPMRMTGLPYGEGRTQIAAECLNRGYEYVFYLDTDVIPPPNTLTRLLSHRLPIVSGLYHQKFPTWTGMDVKFLPCMFNEGRDAQGNTSRVEIPFQYGQLVEAHFIPAGCLLVHRSVFERFLAAGIKRFFQWTMTADEPSGLSEDFWFSRTAWQLGYKCTVDTGIQCLHETEGKVDVRGLSAKI